MKPDILEEYNTVPGVAVNETQEARLHQRGFASYKTTLGSPS